MSRHFRPLTIDQTRLLPAAVVDYVPGDRLAQFKIVRDMAWKAQVRLCARYRRLAATGKPKVVVATAIAREMVGFLSAIARQTQIGVNGAAIFLHFGVGPWGRTEIGPLI